MYLLLRTFCEERDGMLPPRHPEFMAINLGESGDLLHRCSKAVSDFNSVDGLVDLQMEKIVFRFDGASFWYADHGAADYDFHEELKTLGCVLVETMPEKSPNARPDRDRVNLDQPFVAFHSSNPGTFFLEADMVDENASVFSQQFDLAEFEKLQAYPGVLRDEQGVSFSR